MVNIGKRIKELRKEKGFTQTDLSFKTQLSQGFISKIEKNDVKLNKEQLKNICDALQIEASILVWQAMEETDVNPSKKTAYKKIKPLVDELINNLI